MANAGRFFDRSPIVCPAGKPSAENATIWSCFKDYPFDDKVAALKHEAGVFQEKEEFPFSPQRMRNIRNRGMFNEARPSLRPPVTTRYQTLINDLKETSYKSYWEKPDGRSRDAIANLPAGMIPLDITFGAPTKKGATMKELINPPKTPYQVLWDSQVAHEMYRKTHNDYNPSEQTKRGYTEPPYEPDRRFGKRTKYDPRGILVKCACHWHQPEPVTTLSEPQADYIETRRHRLAKCLEPNQNINSVPKGHTFGKKNDRPLFGMKELLRDYDVPPCIFKRDFDEWMAHLNHLRQYIKRRKRFDFSLDDLEDSIRHYDKDRSGWVSLDVLYHLCDCVELGFDHKLMEPLLALLGYTDQCCVYYKAFLDLLDLNKPLPDIVKINDLPQHNLYYISTKMASTCDRCIINNSGMTTAGLPSLRTDFPWPLVPEGGCRAHLTNLGAETSAGQIIYPSVYTLYNLSHRDFFQPRSQEQLKTLFQKIGYTFPEDTFERLWKIGVENDKTGSVCVDTFYNLLQMYFPPPRPPAEEDTNCPGK